MNARTILKLFFISALFLLSSCKEYFITTKINSDGTVEKTIIVKQDRNDGKFEAEAWLKKEGWNVVLSADSSASKNILTATKIFPSFEAFDSALVLNAKGFVPVFATRIEKHFRFFFTYFTYKETYKAQQFYKPMPVDRYFTPDELGKLKEGIDSAWTKNKLEEYNNYIMLDSYFEIMNREFLSKDKIDLNSLIPADKKKLLFAELSAPGKKDDEIEAVLKNYFGSQIALKIVEFSKTKNPEIENMDKTFSVSDGAYNNSVIMPGIITSSNSKIIEGNRVTWKFDQDKFKFFDFEMTAESREVNVWVIVVSSVIILLLLAGLLISRIRK